MKQRGFKTTGEFADQFGLSVNGLKFYINKGLLEPSYNGAYRTYGAHDLSRIFRINQYRSLGFTLAEIAELLRQGETHPVLEVLDEKEAELEGVLASVEERLLNIRRHRRRLQECLDLLGVVEERIYPETYFAVEPLNQEDITLYLHEETRSKYRRIHDYLPYVMFGYLRYRGMSAGGALGGPFYGTVSCLGEDVLPSGLADFPAFQSFVRQPSCQALHVFFADADENAPDLSELDALVDYAYAHGLSARDYAFADQIAIVEDPAAQKRRRYFEGWLLLV